MRQISAGFLTCILANIIMPSPLPGQTTPADDLVQKICGTWVNTSYAGDPAHPQKVVLRPDRTYQIYDTASKNSPADKGDFIIADAWKNPSGLTYCKVRGKSLYAAGSSFELWKFDAGMNRWEVTFSPSQQTYPSDEDSQHDSSGTFQHLTYSRLPGQRSISLPDSIHTEEYTEFIYARPEGKALKAAVFLPDAARGMRRCPAIAIFHGGGWAIGDHEWAFGLARHFASLGMVGVAVQYRLSDQISVTPLEAMADARAAIRWMRSKAIMLGIDTGRIAAYGWSAGAHLAASAAIFDDPNTDRAGSASPDALILVSPAVYLESDQWSQTLLGARADASSVSPAAHIRKNLPPALVLIGRHDTVTPLPGVQLFCDRMQAAGNRCDMQIYEGVGHMFTPDSIRDDGWPQPDEKIQADALKRADEFLASLGFLR